MQLRSGISARGFVAFPDGVHPQVVEDRRGQTGEAACPHSPSHSFVHVLTCPGHTMPTSATLVTILTTHPHARSGRREALSEDDAYGGSGPWRALPRSAYAGVAEMRPCELLPGCCASQRRRDQRYDHPCRSLAQAASEGLQSMARSRAH